LTGGNGVVASPGPFVMKAGYIVRLAGFVAHVVRVTLLALVTYYLGDRVAQGFLHGLAGIVVMFVALIAFFAVDGLVCWLIRPKYANATEY
jgi:exosortase/archaeosortase family protein